MARSTLKRTWPSGLKLCLLKPGLSHCQCSVRLSARTRPARNLVAVLFLCTLIDIVYESTLHASQHIHTHKHITTHRRGGARHYSLARSLARKHTQTHLCSHIGLIRGRHNRNLECTGIYLHYQRGKLLEDLRCRTWTLAMVLGGLRNLETQISERLNNVKKVQVDLN